MTSSIDTNVLVSLWDEDGSNMKARRALDEALRRGKVVVCGAVYGELMGAGHRSPAMLDEFFRDTRIAVDWEMDRGIWERAGMAYQGLVQRRRKNKANTPKGMLTDFLIAAHAVRHGHTLVSLDKRGIRIAFPELLLIES